MDWEENNEEWLEKFDDTGNYDSCVFLVGPDGGRQWQISVSMAKFGYYSDKICAILNSGFPLPQPIQLKNIEPRIFEILVQYVETGRVDEVDVNCLEVAKVCVAAEFLLIQCHKIWSTDYLTRNIRVENFWPVLDILLSAGSKDVASAIVLVLKEKSFECLEQPNFFTAKPLSVKFFLANPKLKISSELRLFQKCYLWAQNQPDTRQAMLDTCLPCLRLLTLTKRELSSLPQDVFEERELNALMESVENNALSEDTATLNLCVNSKNRSVTPATRFLITDYFPEFVIDVIPRRCFEPKDSHHPALTVSSNENLVNTLVFSTKEHITITSCSVISRLDEAVNYRNYSRSSRSAEERWLNNCFTIECGSDPELIRSYTVSRLLPTDSVCNLRDNIEVPFFVFRNRENFLKVTMKPSRPGRTIAVRRNTIEDVNHQFLLRCDHFEVFRTLRFVQSEFDLLSNSAVFLKSISFTFAERNSPVQRKFLS